MTRRDFLHSTLLIPALPLLVPSIGLSQEERGEQDEAWKGEPYYWTPKDFDIKPRFIPYCSFFRSPEQLVNGRLLPVGLTPPHFDYAINEVYKRMLQEDLDHIPRRAVKKLAQLIGSKTWQLIQNLQLANKPPLLHTWLFAEAACAWVATHVVYDGALATAPPEERIRRAKPQTVLDQETASGVCSGQSALTAALAQELGVKATHLGGEAIWYGERAQGKDNHGWVHFDFGNGIYSAADTSQGAMSLNDMRRIDGKMNWDYILPHSPMELELFLAKHYAYGTNIDESKDYTFNVNDKTPYYALFTMPCTDWITIDTSYLKEVWKQYREAEYEKVKWLNEFEA